MTKDKKKMLRGNIREFDAQYETNVFPISFYFSTKIERGRKLFLNAME